MQNSYVSIEKTMKRPLRDGQLVFIFVKVSLKLVELFKIGKEPVKFYRSTHTLGSELS